MYESPEEPVITGLSFAVHNIVAEVTTATGSLPTTEGTLPSLYPVLVSIGVLREYREADNDASRS